MEGTGTLAKAKLPRRCINVNAVDNLPITDIELSVIPPQGSDTTAEGRNHNETMRRTSSVVRARGYLYVTLERPVREPKKNKANRKGRASGHDCETR